MKKTLTCLAAIAVAVAGCEDSTVEPGRVDFVDETEVVRGIRLSAPAEIDRTQVTYQLTRESQGGALRAPDDEVIPTGTVVNLKRVARIPAPVIAGSRVQANDILIDGNRAHVAYNFQGAPWVGAYQMLDITDPADPETAGSVAEFANADINAVGVDGNRLLLAGAGNPSVFTDVLGDDMRAFATHADVNNPTVTELNANMVGLPSFAGTGIARQGDNYYVGTGADLGGIQVLDVDFNWLRSTGFEDVRDIDAYNGGIIAITGTTDSDETSGHVLVGDADDPTVHDLPSFGSDFHKATVEIFQETTALLGVSSDGFKVLDLSSGQITATHPNPEPNAPGQQTNTNSVTTNGTFVATANGEYGFRLMDPVSDNFNNLIVLGFFASELQPPDVVDERFSVNHVAFAPNDCLYVAAGAWGVYVYCIELELPELSLTKTANPDQVVWTSGGLGDFDPDLEFLNGENAGIEQVEGDFLFPNFTCDDAGPDDEPNQVDFNCMRRGDNVPGVLALQWTWDATGVWEGQGQTGDGCALLDTDENGDANFAACVRIENDPETGELLQVGGDGHVDFYSCGDKRNDRCSQAVDLIEDVGSTTCTVEIVPSTLEGSGNFNSQDDPENDVKAHCELDLAMPALAAVTDGPDDISLLNVCAFPSGEPNSNPFDCVVTPGSGFIQITKLVTPNLVDVFGFTLSPASTDGTSTYAVESGVTTALIPVAPGSDYSLTETLPSGWFFDTAACTTNAVETGTVGDAAVTDIVILTGQTTRCVFENFAQASKDVTFTIVVTNHSIEPLTLTSLVDDMFDDLNGVGDCATGGSIAQEGGTYTCSFTVTLTGAPGDPPHVNVVTATAEEDEGEEAEASDSETVEFVDGTQQEQ